MKLLKVFWFVYIHVEECFEKDPCCAYGTCSWPCLPTKVTVRHLSRHSRLPFLPGRVQLLFLLPFVQLFFRVFLFFGTLEWILLSHGFDPPSITRDSNTGFSVLLRVWPVRWFGQFINPNLLVFLILLIEIHHSHYVNVRCISASVCDQLCAMLHQKVTNCAHHGPQSTFSTYFCDNIKALVELFMISGSQVF